MKAAWLKRVLGTVGTFLSSGLAGQAWEYLDENADEGVRGLALEHGLPALGEAISTWTEELIDLDQLRAAVAKTRRVVPFDLASLLDSDPAEAGP